MREFLRPGRFLLAASALLSVLGTAAGLVPFLIVYLIAGSAIDGQLSKEAVIRFSLIAFGGIAAKVVLTTLASALSHRAAYDALYRIRDALVVKLGRTAIGYFSGKPVGELKKVINEDVEQLEEVLAHAIPDICASVAVPVSCAVALSFIDWRLALVSVVMFPLLVVIYPVTLASTKTMSDRYYTALGALRNATIEFLQGMKVIRAFLAANHVPGKFNAAIDELAHATRTMSNAALFPGALMMVGLRANIILLLPVGGSFFVAGTIDANTFVLFLLMGMGVNASAYKLLMTAGTFGMRVATAGKQIAAVLDAPEPERPDKAIQPKQFGVTFKNVSFEYEDGKGVQNVSFSAPEGSFTGIVGPSGAGKTTLARLVGRFWDVQDGSVEIGGVDLRKTDPERLMNDVSFILQDAWLFNTSIRENIRIGRPEAPEAAVQRAAEQAFVTNFADEMPEGLDSPVGEGGRRLSGGQRQRVAIARAILRDSPILVMDEATSSLDPDTEDLVLGALEELAKGRTVIAIAHRLDTIRSADNILYMEEGRVVAQGRHADLLVGSENYARLCECYEASGGWRLEKSEAPLHLRADQAVPPQEASSEKQESWSVPTGGGAIRLFFALLGPNRKTYLRGALPLLFLEGVFMGAPVVATMLALLDLYADRLTMERVWLYTAFVCAAFLLQGLFNILGNRVLWTVQTRTAARLQHRLGQHLRRTPLGILKNRDTGALEALITQHVPELNFVTPTTQIMRAVVAPGVSFALMLYLDWRLALSVVATVPVFLLVVAQSDRIYNGVWQAMVASRERISARVLEFLQGVPTLRSLGLGARQMKGLDAALAHHRDVSLSTITRTSLTLTAGLSVLDLSFCVILLVGGFLVVDGSLSLPVYLIFLVVGLVFYGPIGDAFELAAYRRQQERSMQRVAEILALPVLPEPPAKEVPAGMDVQFDDVGFSYGETPALRNVSIELPAGGLYAFVGHSGSGKTTALDLLARFWDVSSGAIKVGGVDIRQLSQEQRARLFAIVFQDTFLFNDTIANNLRVANPNATDAELVAAAKVAHCHDFIVALERGYDSAVGEAGARLSGGQRQRLAIARAVLKNAPIVLLDEATASIDPEAEYDIRSALSALCAGRTVIVVAHRLSSVSEADQIIVFESGQVVDKGSFDTLADTSPAFAKLLNAANKRGKPVEYRAAHLESA